MLNNDFLSLSDAIPKPTDELLILLVSDHEIPPSPAENILQRLIISFTYTLKFPPFDVVHEVGADINKGKKEKRRKKEKKSNAARPFRISK